MQFGRLLRRSLGAGVMALALASPALSETLADAMVAAYKNSDLLDQNRALLRAADEDVAGTVASLRPVLSWAAESGYAKTLTGFEGWASSLSLSAEMMIYDFGRSDAALAAAKESVLATRQLLLNVEQGVLLGAVGSYMDVRSASENVAINQNSVRVIRKELAAVQDRFSVGEVTKTDVSLAEARLAAAEAGLAASQGALAVARENYLAATGHYPSNLAAAPRLPALPKTVEEAKAIAMRTHPAIKQAQHEVTVAELRVTGAAAQRRPILGAGGEFSVDADGRETGQIGLKLSQQIYTGGALSSAHRKAMAGRDAARAGLLSATASVGQSVGQAWAQIAVARAQIAATDQQIRAATAAYEGVREEASLGARTTLDVLDAEQSLLDAQAARITAEANQQVAIYSLLASMGLLTVENLNLGIPTYDPEAYYNAVKSAPATSVQGESLDRVLRAIGGGN